MFFFKNINKLKADSKKLHELAEKIQTCVEGDAECLKENKVKIKKKSKSDNIIIFEQVLKEA